MNRMQQAIANAQHPSRCLTDPGRELRSGTASDTPWPQTMAANGYCDAGFDLRDIYRLELDSNILRKNKVVTGLFADPQAADYRATAAGLLQYQANDHWNGLAVTSPEKANGKTLTTINIAMALAGQVNHPVVVVDLDLPEASVQKTLGFDCEVGLSDYLQRKIPLDWAMIQVVHPNLLVMPAGTRDKQCFADLTPAAIQDLHDDVCVRLGDCTVLYDLPPLLCNEGARRLISAFDAALLIVEDGVTRDTEVNDAFDFLVDTRWVGTVLNKAV